MLQFTKQQLDQRWDALPINLREVLCSPDYGKIIWDIGEKNHLTDEKIGKIVKFSGFIVMGFIHPEDLAAEIKLEIGINQEIVNSITGEINRKIFAPIKSDLEKVYKPVEEIEEVEEEIKSEEVTLSQESEHVVDLRAKSEEKREAPIGPLPAMPRPENLTDEELINLRTFEKIGGQKEGKNISRESAPGESSSATGGTGPVIIHKEAEFKPVSAIKRSLGGMFGFLKKDGAPPPPKSLPIAARIEIEDKDRQEKFEPGIAKTQDPKIRVVHYSQFQTPLAPPTSTQVSTSAPAPTLTSTSAPAPVSATSAPAVKQTNETPAKKTDEKSDGNIIDLRNFEIKQSGKSE